MIFVLMLALSSLKIILGEECENILCSNIFDYVCGMAKSSEGTIIIMKYQNICHLESIRCRMKDIVEIKQIPKDVCGIESEDSLRIGRRLNDFSIVGAHQACNHTCPTYCVDTYEPACAQIWKRGTAKSNYRAMVNHCHIDLFSCAVGVNVTILPIGKCFKSPQILLFMSQVAAMKSLQLLETRRTSYEDGTKWQMQYIMDKLYQFENKDFSFV